MLLITCNIDSGDPTAEREHGHGLGRAWRLLLLLSLQGFESFSAPLPLLTELCCPHCHPGGWKTALLSLDVIFSHYVGNLCPEYICLGAETCEMF